AHLGARRRCRTQHVSLFCSCPSASAIRYLPSFPTRRSSDLPGSSYVGIDLDPWEARRAVDSEGLGAICEFYEGDSVGTMTELKRSEEHTSELQSRENLVCRLLLEKKNKISKGPYNKNGSIST